MLVVNVRLVGVATNRTRKKVQSVEKSSTSMDTVRRINGKQVMLIVNVRGAAEHTKCQTNAVLAASETYRVQPMVMTRNGMRMTKCGSVCNARATKVNMECGSVSDVKKHLQNVNSRNG